MRAQGRRACSTHGFRLWASGFGSVVASRLLSRVRQALAAIAAAWNLVRDAISAELNGPRDPQLRTLNSQVSIVDAEGQESSLKAWSLKPENPEAEVQARPRAGRRIGVPVPPSTTRTAAFPRRRREASASI